MCLQFATVGNLKTIFHAYKSIIGNLGLGVKKANPLRKQGIMQGSEVADRGRKISSPAKLLQHNERTI